MAAGDVTTFEDRAAAWAKMTDGQRQDARELMLELAGRAADTATQRAAIAHVEGDDPAVAIFGEIANCLGEAIDQIDDELELCEAQRLAVLASERSS